MLRALLIALIAIPASTNAQSGVPELQRASDAGQRVHDQRNADTTKAGSDRNFVMVEVMPEYPGGQAGMFQYLAKVKYPADAIDGNVQGTVIVQFVVDKEGPVRDVTVLRGIGSGCDEEAVRVITAMPSWVPGTQQGKAVNVKMTIPIRFQLDEGAKPVKKKRR